MYDIKWIRENPELFDRGMERRGLNPVSADILSMDKEHRAVLVKLQELQQKRNELSQKVGEIKKSGGDADNLMKQVTAMKDDMSALEGEERVHAKTIEEKLSFLPNAPLDDVPLGADENNNVEVMVYGEPTKFPFSPKAHDELGIALGMMDFEQAAIISGARFTILKGDLARLERALGQFMLDLHTQRHGYTEVSVPILVHSNALYGTAQLPKFAEDLFQTTADHWLIPTAEVPLTNLGNSRVFEEDELPLRVTGLTPCFRSEAGSAGKDTKGMLRQHQFYKVEMVSITTPETSLEELERMRGCAETVLKELKIPFRTIVLCTGDMGFGSRKTYDVEAWIPAQDKYREISSCSICGDFQALRMNARYKKKGLKGTLPVHTLNGSGLAVGRTLIAVMENYQQEDGSIVIPEVIRPYMGGQKIIGKK